MRLYALSALVGAAAAAVVACSFRSHVAYAAAPAAALRESQAQVLRAAVFACAEAGGTWAQGLEDGVLLGRCYPVPNVGIVKVGRKRR